MAVKNTKLPVRTDCRYYNAEKNCCKVLTELYCTKKHDCGFHQDVERKRLPTIRRAATKSIRNRAKKVAR